MKRYLLVLSLILAVALAPLGAKGAAELQKTVVQMAVMQGPSGFGSVGLTKDGGVLDANTSIELTVYPSPNEVIARLANNEIDVAALPTNVAANLYNKGVPVKLAAVVGEGMLMLLTTDSSITTLSDLASRNLFVPGVGGTPDQMARILTMALGFDPQEDIILDYSITAPAQLAQMLIANRVDLALLPEPFVTMSVKANPKVITLIDIQQVWSAVTGVNNYPMTVVVLSDSFVASHPEAVAVVMNAIKESINWVNENPVEASRLIEQEGIMKAEMAVGAIPNSQLLFKTSKEALESLDLYLKVLYGFDESAIGGKVPDEDFYLSY